MIVGGQLPDSVQVLGQHDDGVDLEKVIGAGLAEGFA